MTRSISTEPIARSYLADPRNWPPAEAASHVTRLATAEDQELVRLAGEQVDFGNPDFLKRFPLNSGNPAQTISRILSGNKLNFNGGRVYEQISPSIAAACSRGEPIQVVMPCFCKINNTAKVVWSLRPTAAEEVSLRHLAHVSRSLRQWYPPGVRFVLLTDARLYASYLRNLAPTVAAYNQGLEDLRARVAPNGEVELIEYDELLAPLADEFEAAYADALRRLESGDRSFFAHLDRQAIFESVRNNVSTRSLGMTYDDLRECFGPNRNPENRFHELLNRSAEESLAWKLAVRAACRAVESRVLTRAFGPNYVRATIHVARGDMPALGLRIYPDYKRSSDVLPYHGVPLLYRDGDRVKMLVAPETRFRTAQYVRVTHHGNETFLYRRAVV